MLPRTAGLTVAMALVLLGLMRSSLLAQETVVGSFR